jgi:spore maturation protein CgeB
MLQRHLQKIDVFLPRSSQYGVLHHFTRQLYEALGRRGFTCRLLEGEDQLYVPLQDPPQLTIGFNGAPRDAEQRLFCDRLKVPHLACLVDPPYHFPYLFKSPYILISCDDRMGCLLLSELGFERSFFLPHATESELFSTDETPERLFDVTLLASFIDFEGRRQRWKKKFPSPICQALEEAIDMIFSGQPISFIQAFNHVLGQVQQKYPPDHFKNLNYTKLLKELELYVKGRDKAQLLHAIHDVPIHIFGGTIDKMSWKQYLAKSESPIYAHGSVSFEQALKIMKKSKILLNPALKNSDGAHERVFAGIASGALVLTNPSRYLDEHFQEGEDILYYRHSSPEKTNALIHTHLSHPEQCLGLIEKGRAKVLEYETWDARVSTLLQEVPPLLDKILQKS